MFMPFTVTHVRWFTCDSYVDSMARVQSAVDDKAVFVFVRGPMLITLSGWSQFLLLIDIGVMLLIFEICLVVSRCCVVPLTLLAIDSIL